MANVKELKSIIKSTPESQALLIEGIHGIGKTEVVSQYFQKKGYRVQVLFLGQLSDAGDLIGLPMREEIKVNGKKRFITTFAPPAWYPMDENEKVVLFLDEINRARPEILQVVMDLVLNRKLNNIELPKNCRIISAMNPPNDGYYQVEDLDPALLDRFNRYNFNPTVNEWLDWGMESKVNTSVLGFISKHSDKLDPPISAEYVADMIHPSRRSWKRVSDILNLNDNLLEDSSKHELGNMLEGIVGLSSTSLFIKHLSESKKGIGAGYLLNNWDSKVQAKVKKLKIDEVIYLNRQLSIWFEENLNILSESAYDSTAQKVVVNLEKYLSVIPAEAMAEFYTLLGNDNNSGKTYPSLLFSKSPNLGSKMLDVINGVEEDSALKENLEK